VLALSAGGSYGAFSAGLLNGWTDSGARPTFDVVTGVSAGALAATYAFLGSTHDAELKKLFTTVSDRDIYRRRGPLAPLRSDSVASNAPLRELIQSHMTPDVLGEVARAHAQGRRLYVGTTNLDTKRLVVWDMGAIATRGDANLYADLLLASAAIPGFFPPVSISVEVNGRRYTETHVDGGVTAQVFVQRSTLGPESTVWIAVAGKIYADPEETGSRTLEIGANAVSALLHAQTRGDIHQVQTVCRQANAEFRFAAIPADFPIEPSEQLFDPTVMGDLFRIGFTVGRNPARAWRNDLPDATEDTAAPRTGTRFFAPQPQRGGLPSP
jgi:predicted acylesterase/phospholipase RssA